MYEFIGRQTSVGVAIETSRGVAKTTAQRWLRKTEVTLAPKNTRVTDDTTFGRLEDAQGARVIQKWAEGDLNGIMHIDALGYIMLNIYGGVTPGAVASQSPSVYDNVFTMQNNIQHPSLTFLLQDSAVRQVAIAGGMIKTFELTAPADDYVRFSCTISGQDEAVQAATPTLLTEYDFIGRDVNVKVAANVAAISGATALETKDLTISWDTGAKEDFVHGKYGPDDIYNGPMAIEGSFTRNFVDKTFYDLFRSGAFQAMQVKIEGEAIIGTSALPSFLMLLDKVQITDWNRSGDADEVVTEEVSWKAFFDPATTRQSQVTLRNLQNGYAGV